MSSEIAFTAFERFRRKDLMARNERPPLGTSKNPIIVLPPRIEESSDDEWWGADRIDEIWDQAHREHAELLRQELMYQTVQLSRIERFFITPFIFATRAFAGTTMLAIWFCVVGPIWFAILLRTIAAFSIATVVALFTHATPPDAKRLDAIAELWVVGFRKIIASTFQNEPGPANRIPIQPIEALREIGFALLLYGGMYSTFLTIGAVYKHIFG